MVNRQDISRQSGFTLIELVIVIVVLGLLGGVAIPRYHDIALDAKMNACKGALGGLRSGIAMWGADQVLAGSGAPTWPPLDSMATHGVVMVPIIPKNPFQLDGNAPDSVVLGVTKGVTVGTRGGWAYKPSTGEIWPNTSTTIPASGCNPRPRSGRTTGSSDY
jgi:prepilin-type N-terminal cleavage/methylation domain-containing protein